MVRRRTPPAFVPSARRRRLLGPQALEVVAIALIGSPPDPGYGVDIGGLPPESLRGASLLGPGGERVERVVTDGTGLQWEKRGWPGGSIERVNRVVPSSPSSQWHLRRWRAHHLSAA